MSLFLKFPPPCEPLGLQETKRYLRISSELEDPLMTSLISDSRVYVENITGRALLKQGWQLQLTPPYPPSFPLAQTHYQELSFILPKPPLLEVVSVKSKEKEVPFAQEDSKLKIASQFYGEPLLISFWAGYGETPDSLPADLKMAVLVGVEALYEGKKMDLSLLAPYRVLRIN